MVTAAGLSDAEGNVILWVSCFPTFQPIIRQVSYKVVLRSTAGPTNPQPRRVSKILSGLTSTRKSAGQVQLGSQDENESTSHIISYEGRNGDIELGERRESGGLSNDIVKEARIEVHSDRNY